MVHRNMPDQNPPTQWEPERAAPASPYIVPPLGKALWRGLRNRCPVCGQGRLNLKTARSGGAFIGCTNYPECRYTRPLSAPDGEAPIGDRVLGEDAGDQISLKTGRFGPYVQRGEATEEAAARGVIGVPSVVAGDAVFWGDDRLADAARAVRG